MNHKNIIKLIDIQYAYYADSYIFITLLYPTTLEQKLTESPFISDKNGLKPAINWLKNILDDIVYIHDKGLSLNDVLSNNILISDDGTTIVADLEFLTSAENLVQR